MKYLLFTILLSTFLSIGMYSNVVQADHVEAELISEVSSISPGQPFYVALRMDLDPHWHIYWINAGDAGFPPSISWELPEGFSAGEIEFPHPKKIPFDGYVNFGLEDQALLLVRITPPATLKTGSQVTLKADAQWLLCKDVCIPESGKFNLSLPVSVSPTISDKQASLFADARSKLPLRDTDWKFEAGRSDTTLLINIIPPDWFKDDLGSVTYFPYDQYVIDNAAPQPLSKTPQGYQLAVALSPGRTGNPQEISGILVSDNGWRGPDSEMSHEVKTKLVDGLARVAGSPGSSQYTLLYALFGAFVGGIILNLMPCVLPVLSLKIMGFVQQAGEEPKKVFYHGLMFTLGVLVSFWILAGLLIALRASGAQFGWGFQLQSPEFVIILTTLLFLFALNLFGLFEIGTSLMGVGQGRASGSGMTGSFFTGVTATVVATPCTAPFMGGALGFALSQPAAVSMLIFTILALGMAMPYIVLSSSPGLLKFVPKPGPWMNHLKEFMGFLMMASVIFLLYVLGGQAGLPGVMIALLMLLFVGLAGWIFGRFGNVGRATAGRRIAQVTAAALIIVSTYFAMANTDVADASPATATTASHGITWAEFSPELVSELRQERKPVFIDFTAKWCLSCQVNKQVAFSSTEVQQKFEELGINAIKADWTNYDEKISKALAEFGRNSVPLYVLYSADPSKKPIILPELLSPGIVLDALERLN